MLKQTHCLSHVIHVLSSDGSLKLGAYKIFSWCFSANNFLLPSVLFHASCFNLSPNNIECQNHARQRVLYIKASGTDHAKILWSAECLNVYCQKYICMFFLADPGFPRVQSMSMSLIQLVAQLDDLCFQLRQILQCLSWFITYTQQAATFPFPFFRFLSA